MDEHRGHQAPCAPGVHDGRHQQSQQRAARGRSHDDGPAQRYAEYHEFFGKQPHDQQAEATADKHDGTCLASLDRSLLKTCHSSNIATPTPTITHIVVGNGPETSRICSNLVTQLGNDSMRSSPL